MKIITRIESKEINGNQGKEIIRESKDQIKGIFYEEKSTNIWIRYILKDADGFI